MNMIEKICLKGYEKHILWKLTAILSKNPMKNIRKYILMTFFGVKILTYGKKISLKGCKDQIHKASKKHQRFRNKHKRNIRDVLRKMLENRDMIEQI